LVRSAACYEVKGMDLETIKTQIEGYKPESRKIMLGGKPADASTKILIRENGAAQVSGTLERVDIKKATFRGHPYQTPILYTAGFAFMGKEKMNLLVHAGKKIAKEVVKEFRSIFSEEGVITRIRLNTSDIDEIRNELNGGEVYLTAFKDLDSLELSKGTITGEDVREAPPFNEFNSKGKMSYIMFVAQKYGNLALSITEDCQITFYNKEIVLEQGKTKVDREFVEEFVKNEIF